MRKQWQLAAVGAVLLTIDCAAPNDASAGIFQSREEQRAKIDADQVVTLEKLFIANPKAKRLYEAADGFATFDIVKVSFGITGGGGQGVAVNKATGQRIYMSMGTGGLNFGAGGQIYQLIFLFEDQETFAEFANNGWEAGASANAVAGSVGANAGTSFVNGIAVYQITQAGLMLQLDISGTRFWQSKLNRP